VLQTTSLARETLFSPFILYGCETWSLTLREEHRVRVFENRVLRRIFGPKTEKQQGGRSYKMTSFMIGDLFEISCEVRTCSTNCEDREFIKKFSLEILE
jgi:hypothetical protein